MWLGGPTRSGWVAGGGVTGAEPAAGGGGSTGPRGKSGGGAVGRLPLIWSSCRVPIRWPCSSIIKYMLVPRNSATVLTAYLTLSRRP